MLSKIRMNRKGFTLIELMIVVAIIGILAAIAIPQFTNYRRRGQSSAAQSALKNLGTAQETYFIDHGRYATTIKDLTDAKTGFRKDPKITYFGLSTYTGGSGEAGFKARAAHIAKGALTFDYWSLEGGVQPRSN